MGNDPIHKLLGIWLLFIVLFGVTVLNINIRGQEDKRQIESAYQQGFQDGERQAQSNTTVAETKAVTQEASRSFKEYVVSRAAAENEASTTTSATKSSRQTVPDNTEHSQDWYFSNYANVTYIDRSTALSAAGYDTKTAVLFVVFKDSGSMYLYYDVPQQVYVELVSADSIGKYYNSNIKSEYYCERVR